MLNDSNAASINYKRNALRESLASGVGRSPPSAFRVGPWRDALLGDGARFEDEPTSASQSSKVEGQDVHA